MDDKNKGLADTQEGDFILNESGTSVSIDPVDDGVEGDIVKGESKAQAKDTDARTLRGDTNKR